MLTAAELESGSADGLEGALGEGEGEWQLIVSSKPAVRVMNLLDTANGHLSNLSSRPKLAAEAPVSDWFARYNELEPKPWWKPSAPYSCLPTVNADSPWTEAGLPDLGGADPLSLIRWYGNGSYVRYGHMGFHGCTRMWEDPRETHLDTPADPSYYAALGDVDIHVDIARVPEWAPGWWASERVDTTLEEAVKLLNDHVAPYYRKISRGAFRLSFLEGEDFVVSGDGSPAEMQGRHREIQRIECDDYPCSHSAAGAANRLLFVDTETGAGAWNGNITMGLQFMTDADMEVVVHEIGHAWLFWPHSYAEVMWQP